MASFRDLVYRHSPYALQNIMISAYGLHLRSIRYSRQHLQKLSFLDAASGWDFAQIENYQTECLRKFLRKAIKEVPYYRAKYEEIFSAIDKIDAQTLRNFFPVLDKAVVRKNAKDFVSEYLPDKQRTVVFTSGTTGAPLEVISSKTAVAENFAFFSDFLKRCGLNAFDWSVTFAGRLIAPQEQQKPPFWRCNLATRTWLFSSYHISTRTIPTYLAQLEKVQPTYIDSYPSAIYAIAKYVVDRQIKHSIQLKAIVTSSETLTPLQRQTIEQAFHCTVFDQYGSAEMAAFVSQCPFGTYHVNPFYGLLEVIDREGQPCLPGDAGELVLTGFLNEAMPLIRYRIGDRAAFSMAPCSCGLNYPALAGILGREDDYIVTPDGNYVGRLDPLFKGLHGLIEAQIVQESLTHIEVLLVPDANFDEPSRVKLIDGLRQRVGDKMTINVRLVDVIPRSKNGKFRSVVSKVEKTNAVNSF